MNRFKRSTWTSTLVALLLAACGGGGGVDGGIGGTGGGGGVDGGIGGTGVSYGGITGFGSVWVNGVRFDTSATTIRLDDRTVTQDSLRIGMLVRVDGSIAGSSATTIRVDEPVKGRVEQVLDANRMVVMGQTVQIDAQTRFEGGVVPVLGDLVDVHGLLVADGAVAAGYVERRTTPATPPFAVKGFVKNHDPAAQTLAIGALTVRYSGATVSDMPAGSWNGLTVEVKGSTCAATPVCGTLTATRLQPNGLRVSAAPAAEVEGYVGSLTAGGFMLGTQAVAVTASTVYENGTSADLAVGLKLEAEGPISGGVLTATKVSYRDNVRLEASVAAVGFDSLSLTALPGVTVQVNSLTRWKGGASALATLAAGNHLRIRGRAGAGNVVVATELELRSDTPDSRLVLQGPLSALASPSFTILGVAVDSSGVSDSGFFDNREVVVGRAAFFAALAVGKPVKARGDLRSGAIRWQEFELEE
jgi:Domain of unknown function (DUF5666)